MAGKLILVRHGQSDWNLKNLFTGWTDVDLTVKGVQEALEAGKLLAGLDYDIDIAYTSVLKRAIRTLWIMLDEMDRMWIPVVRDWRLNERHYGALQGLNKAETSAKYGEEQVHIWRRSYACYGSSSASGAMCAPPLSSRSSSRVGVTCPDPVSTMLSLSQPVGASLHPTIHPMRSMSRATPSKYTPVFFSACWPVSFTYHCLRVASAA